MKKIFTIGRDTQCDICINDSSDVVSRNHAVLEIGKNGKYFITDQSRNGTYVNGMRISQNEKVPVTREDIISLAHVRELDWSLIPKNSNIALLAGIVASAIVLMAVVVFLLFFGNNKDIHNSYTDDMFAVQSSESCITDTTANIDNTVQDSASQAVEDNKSDDNKDNGKTGKHSSPKGKKKATDNKKDLNEVIDAIY